VGTPPQYELRRTVRVVIDPAAQPGAGSNGFAGTPAPVGLPRHYEFDVRCAGVPDEHTGYLVDIKAIDRAVRERAAPILDRACTRADARPGEVLADIVSTLARELGPGLASVCWRLTPYHSIEARAARRPAGEDAMDATTRQTDPETRARASVLLRERFDFAAAHRLHVPTKSDEENRSIFGKCNNPSGHGHNYQIEPCVEVDTSGDAAPFGFVELERATRASVIEPFDHKHLNKDTAEFGEGGVNPSVENMARVFFERLAPAIRGASAGATLRSVTVWETDRTSCTFPGG